MPTASTLSHDHLLAALERRYDYQSARAVATDLLSIAEVAPAAAYDAAATAKICVAADIGLARAPVALTALYAALVPVPPPAAAPADTKKKA